MNEREKLLQQLDQSYEEKKEEYSDVKPYKATTNFNTALNQPQINVNDVTNLNIQNNEMVNKAMGINNLMETNVSNQNQNIVTANKNVQSQPMNSSFVTSQTQVNNSQVSNNNQVISPQSNNMEIQTPDTSLDVTERFYQEQPIYDAKTEKTTTYISNMENQPQKKKKTIKISKDTQVLLLMVVVIFIFILILPILSNFVNNIRNS